VDLGKLATKGRGSNVGYWAFNKVVDNQPWRCWPMIIVFIVSDPHSIDPEFNCSGLWLDLDLLTHDFLIGLSSYRVRIDGRWKKH
jgi:hypothetical protein